MAFNDSNLLARGQGGTGIPPVTIKQHGRDGRAPWTNRAKPRFYCVFNGMDTA